MRTDHDSPRAPGEPAALDEPTELGGLAALDEPTELGGLAALDELRAELDRRELELIDRARHAGATWAQIAAALGLASRQAAEQRRQRLSAAARVRRQAQDSAYAASIAPVRTAVRELTDRIAADPVWAGRFARATLTRHTLLIAADAEPGALFALTAQALTDLRAARPGRLPGPLRSAITAARQALRAAVPS